MSIEPIAMGEIQPEATLEDCEQALHTVERNAAIQQGVILRHVRDYRLYKAAGFPSFAEYVEQRLGYTRDWAYKRMDLAETRSALLSTNVYTPEITNEGQARAIKPILRDHGPEVAAEVLAEAEASGRVTARSITEAAERRLIVVEDEAPLPANEWMVREGYADPVDDWTDDERRLAELLDSGHTIVVNMRDDAHARLWQYAVQEHKAERIDRKSIWGNPFILGDDGDRDTVCDAYANIYLPHKPRLLAEVSDLKGRALGCWCAPARCHGDHLARLATS